MPERPEHLHKVTVSIRSKWAFIVEPLMRGNRSQLVELGYSARPYPSCGYEQSLYDQRMNET
jgi:hypothetical protein